MQRELPAVLTELISVTAAIAETTGAERQAIAKRLSKLQREFDFLVNELRIEAPAGTDWQRAQGCGCKKRRD